MAPRSHGFGASLIKWVALAALACGAAAWALNAVLDAYTASRLLRSLGLFVAIGAAMVVYFGSAYALRIGETAEALAMVRRRVLRRRA